MNEFNENDIGTLLRLKKHEQPPVGYFDNFLHEFHRRQRAELLREPLWQIGLRRAQDFMGRFSVPSLNSYPAAATAVIILATVLSFKMTQTPQSPGMVAQEAPAAVRATGDSAWSLSTPVNTRSVEEASVFQTVSDSVPTRRSAAPPRYVMDSTPVSYEASFRF